MSADAPNPYDEPGSIPVDTLGIILKRVELLDRVKETARRMTDRIQKAAEDTGLDLQPFSDRTTSDG